MTKVKFEPVPLSFRGKNWINIEAILKEISLRKSISIQRHLFEFSNQSYLKLITYLINLKITYEHTR